MCNLYGLPFFVAFLSTDLKYSTIELGSDPQYI